MKGQNHNGRVGVWLDHAQARFIDVSNGKPIVEIVESPLETQVRIPGETAIGTKLGNYRTTVNEHHRNNKKQNALHNYYKTLSKRLQKYDDIYLFGPTKAKDELYNMLTGDKNFSDKVINMGAASHLTDNQMIAQVRKFFNL